MARQMVTAGSCMVCHDLYVLFRVYRPDRPPRRLHSHGMQLEGLHGTGPQALLEALLAHTVDEASAYLQAYCKWSGQVSGTASLRITYGFPSPIHPPGLNAAPYPGWSSVTTVPSGFRPKILAPPALFLTMVGAPIRLPFRLKKSVQL